MRSEQGIRDAVTGSLLYSDGNDPKKVLASICDHLQITRESLMWLEGELCDGRSMPAGWEPTDNESYEALDLLLRGAGR